MDSDSRYAPPSFEFANGVGPGDGPCGRCGGVPGRIGRYMWVMSFVVLTRHATYEACLCRDCATRNGLKELAKSAVLGWWGIPWGVLTLQALWFDLRALWRWSRIPRAVVLAVAVLGLAAPVSVVAYFVRDARETARAEATGDRGSQEVVDLVNQGNARLDRNEPQEALGFYRKAYEKAPRSSVINYLLARTYVALGDFHAGLPFAQTAAERNPDDCGHVALHGWLLARTGDLEAARTRARRVAAMSCDDAAAWNEAAELLWQVEDWEALDRVATRASSKFPDDPYLTGSRLLALVGKDDRAGFASLWERLPDERRRDASAELAHEIYAFGADPESGMAPLLARWGALELDEVGMGLFVRSAERAGFIDKARERIRPWLADPATAGEAWYLAQPWFPGDRWNAELDAHLSGSADPVPILLRVASLDPVADRTRIAELARRGRESTTPTGRQVDRFYVGVSRLVRPAEAWRAEMEEHLASHPDHDACRLALGQMLIECDPAAARRILDPPIADGDPELLAQAAFSNAELLLVEGRLEEAARAVEKAQRLADPDDVDGARLVILEIALARGDDGTFDRAASALAQSPDAEARAAALVIGWARQAAAGAPPTYHRDVGTWLDSVDVAALRSSSSGSTQALLMIEGRTDPESASRALGQLHPATLELVRALKAAASGNLDRAALDRIADGGEAPYDWARRLARLVRERLRG